MAATCMNCELSSVTPVNAPLNSNMSLCCVGARPSAPHKAKNAAQMASVIKMPMAAAAAVVGRCVLRSALRRSR